MLQLTSSGTIPCSAKELGGLRTEFERHHCVRLPRLLEPGLFQVLQHQLDSCRFYPKFHLGIGMEYCMSRNTAAGLLQFLTNDPALFQSIRQITRCEPIGFFHGRVYRMLPGHGHFDSWHNDMLENRKIALSINLSPESYQGGILQIRDRKSKKILHEVANVGPGDAILFRLSYSLQHRVRKVTGRVAKTAYAGWFRLKPNFQSLLNKKRSPPPAGPKLHPTEQAALKDKVEISEEAAYQTEKRGVAFFHMKSGVYSKLNESGKRIWEILEQKKTLQTTAVLMAKEHGVRQQTCLQDVLRLVHKLQAAGLVVLQR